MFFTVTRADRKPWASIGSFEKLTLIKTTSMATSAARLSKHTINAAFGMMVGLRLPRDTVFGTAVVDGVIPSDTGRDGIWRVIGERGTRVFLWTLSKKAAYGSKRQPSNRGAH